MSASPNSSGDRRRRLRVAAAIAATTIVSHARARGLRVLGSVKWNGHRVPHTGHWMCENGHVQLHRVNATFATCSSCNPNTNSFRMLVRR